MTSTPSTVLLLVCIVHICIRYYINIYIIYEYMIWYSQRRLMVWLFTTDCKWEQLSRYSHIDYYQKAPVDPPKILLCDDDIPHQLSPASILTKTTFKSYIYFCQSWRLKMHTNGESSGLYWFVDHRTGNLWDNNMGSKLHIFMLAFLFLGKLQCFVFENLKEVVSIWYVYFVHRNKIQIIMQIF